ncbi:hypothetical protein BDB00DRAFT_879632 [Zychaea mexicana]|uniref:uncharacterized protein n=1 Tax=Zychaea mexicana TaxID=64656 RepID=UPI0022FE6D65|nr:uncharacterized protein BDB00DRAFT_879632 [Zychaea mexicana]KAI9474857.1 hypothetical protein BDB00DRAFT_879632 [Zychaea mexicana]
MNILDPAVPSVNYLDVPGTSSSSSQNNPTASTSTGNSSSSERNHNSNNHSSSSRRRSRGLSLSLVDIVSSTTSRNKRNSTSSNHSAAPSDSASSSSSPPTSSSNTTATAAAAQPPTTTTTTTTNNGSSSNNAQQQLSPPPCITKPSELTIEIDGGQQLIIRPNRIMRGTVVLKATRAIHATQIRVKFRAEEVATVRVREATLESKFERIDQLKRTYFNVDTKVWGNDASAFSIKTWDTLEPGEHCFPFALKFPNVNFPPSVDDPLGFSIHYIWSAHVDGAGFHPGLRSRDYVLPYRPIICAPPAQEWTVSETLYKSDKRVPMARVVAMLPQHVFCPDEPFQMHLHVECIPRDLIVVYAMISLEKHYEGKLQLQQGTAYKSASRNIFRSSLSVTGNDGTVSMPIRFQMPTRLVSPSFASKNIRVYYTLTFHIECESAGNALINSMKRPKWTGQFSIPMAIANLPNDHLLRIPELTSIQSYMHSNEPPMFFDPSMDEPLPLHNGYAHSETLMTTPPPQSPPNYFSLTSMPPAQNERTEKMSFTSRLIRPGFAPELGDLATMAEVYDDDW